MHDGGESTLDTLKRLIVGRRGRARADRLVVTSADGVQREIAIKAQKNASAYVDLVEACAPMRIEAYAADELLGVWGEPPVPPPARAQPTKKKTATAPPPPAPVMKKKGRADWAVIERITTHVNTLLASAYKANAEKETAKDKAVWESLSSIAQHHSDRASHAELRSELQAKNVRLANRAILERDALILRLNAKISEIATADSEDKKSEMFMQLLGIAKGDPGAAVAAGQAAAANGATKKAKAS